MKVESLLADLGRRGIELWREGEKLRYRAPAGMMTERLKDELRERKEELLAALGPPVLAPLPPATERPLGFTQERLWFLDRLHGGSAAYNIPLALRLTGPLAVFALAQAAGEISRRHEVLRAGTVEGGEAPALRVAPARPLPLRLADLTGLAPEDRWREIRRLSVAVAERPFDLGHPPLLRLALVRLVPPSAARRGPGGSEHRCLLSTHHFAADGWSMRLLVAELTALYGAFSAGGPSPLAELSLQFADYAWWQRRALTPAIARAQLGYWRPRLGDRPAVLELPADRPRPAVASFRGATRRFALPADLTADLKALGRGEGATLFTVLAAGFAALLYRLTRQRDLTLATAVSHRPSQQLEGLIGPFSNNLVLRARTDRSSSFRRLLGELREVILGALEHQELPFDRLVKELGLERDLSHAPLAQVLLVLQGASVSALRLPGLAVELEPVYARTAKFDLGLSLEETPDGLIGSAEHSTDLFDGTTVGRWLEGWRHLLAAVARQPDRSLEELPLLSPGQRQQLLVEWNHGPSESSGEGTVVELFAARAAEAPAAPAVECAGRDLSYGELAARALRLAARLRRRGVGPDERVAVLLPRSADMVAAILGVLEAGGAYLPLDPDYPADRLAFMLEDSAPAAVVTTAELAGLLPPPTPVVLLGEDEPAAGLRPARGAPRSAGAGDLAYVIYTSGSTGRPKAVMVPHGALTRLVQRFRRIFDLTPGDRLLMVPSMSFDASVGDLFPVLASGATLVLHPDPAALAGEALTRFCAERALSVVDIPAAFWKQWLEALGRPGATPVPPSLRLVVSGGESVAADQVEAWETATGGRVAFLGPYGPTETTVCATYSRTSRGWRRGAVPQRFPIGRPLPGWSVHLVDPRLRPVAVGAAGEVIIGGDGVTRGYQRRPAATAERFLPDPFAALPGARVYRTGDLARRLADGQLEFLGRADQQVKIRGFRVELEEIEAVMARHPAISQAAVAAHPGPAGPRLVGYLVPEAGEAPDLPGLRADLREELPDYMVPAQLMVLDALPVSPNGKLDRRALPAPERGERQVAGGYQAPRDPRERSLAEIWAGVLELDRVGIHDNFFELGGDSILGLQMIARAYQAGLSLDPKAIFQHQTVAELALVAENVGGLGGTEQGPVVGPVPLTPIQRWFLEGTPVDVHHWNQAFLLALDDPGGTARWRQALAVLLAVHDALRLRLARRKDGWRQWIEPPAGEIPFVRVDLTRLPAAAARQALAAAAAELQASLDPASGPLLRVALFDLCPDKTARLLVAVHHLAIDGVSWRILLGDLETVLLQLDQGGPVALPPKTTSFKRWAELLVDRAASPELAAELDYWRSSLPARPVPLRMDFTGVPAAANSVAAAAAVRRRLGAEETRRLLTEVPKVYAVETPHLLLAALVASFAACTGEDRLLVELEGHGRESLFEGVDLSRTVGWFTAAYPVYLDIAGATGPGEILQRVKERLREVPQRGTGYGMLRYLAGGAAAEQLAALPAPQVSFNYLGQLDNLFSGRRRFRLATEERGPDRSLRGRRRHLIEVGAAVLEERLLVTWIYGTRCHRRATLDALADRFVLELGRLVDHCLASGSAGYTPSDFPQAAVTQEELDDLVAALGDG